MFSLNAAERQKAYEGVEIKLHALLMQLYSRCLRRAKQLNWGINTRNTVKSYGNYQEDATV
jgi:hypothetical protein